MRVEVSTIVGGVPGTEIRNALLVATKDKDARVRTSAITALAKSKDATLASTYLPFLNDKSYATISAAANALGETKSPEAYDAFVKLLDTPSWHDQIRAYALSGLARLEDKRALEVGMRYAAAGNWPQVQAAAIRVIGAVGKGDPRAYPIVSEGFRRSVETFNFQLASASGDALVKLGDPRGIDLIEEAIKRAGPQFEGFLRQFQDRLRQAAQSGQQKPAGQ
jgi:HEAT repeat protein